MLILGTDRVYMLFSIALTWPCKTFLKKKKKSKDSANTCEMENQSSDTSLLYKNKSM